MLNVKVFIKVIYTSMCIAEGDWLILSTLLVDAVNVVEVVFEHRVGQQVSQN